MNKTITYYSDSEYSKLEGQLNALSKGGWELMNVVPMENGNQLVCTLRRAM